MNTLLIVSTYNRADLTAVGLESINRCRAQGSEVVIMDDGSSEYLPAWLSRWGRVMSLPHVGPMAQQERRFRFALNELRAGKCEHVILLDSDIVVSPLFDVIAVEILKWGRRTYPGAKIASTSYLSTDPPVRSDGAPHEDIAPGIVKQAGFGGVCRCYDLEAAEYVDAVMADGWHYELWRAFDMILAPATSYIDHVGRFGGGVHGASDDRGDTYVGHLPPHVHWAAHNILAQTLKERDVVHA